MWPVLLTLEQIFVVFLTTTLTQFHTPHKVCSLLLIAFYLLLWNFQANCCRFFHLQVRFIFIIIFSFFYVRAALICAFVPEPVSRFVFRIACISRTEPVVLYLRVCIENRASLGFSLFTSLNRSSPCRFELSEAALRRHGEMRLGRKVFSLDYSLVVMGYGIIIMPLFTALLYYVHTSCNITVTWCDL